MAGQPQIIVGGQVEQVVDDPAKLARANGVGPKLALRIYTKVMGEQRRRSPGARLVGVLDGSRWTQASADIHTGETATVLLEHQATRKSASTTH